jgi:hypothetical protein
MKASRWLRGTLAGGIVALLSSSAFGLTLVQAGRPISLIVLGDKPAPAQRMAAQELQYHLKEMTGAVVPIVTEGEVGEVDATLILVGQSDRLSALGIDTKTLRRETLVVKTVRGALVLAGEDGGSVDPCTAAYNSNRVRTGTLFAVYDFLEDQLGCRWVWPGRSGEVIPKRETIEVGDLDIQETPKLFERRLREDAIPRFIKNSRGKPAMMNFFPRYMDHNDATFSRMQDEEALWLKRMRMGFSERLTYGHAFTQWYDKYHDQYPEIFAMQQDGHRGLPDPTYNKAYVKMCPSSEKLIDLLITEFIAERAKDPDHRFINACENDGNGGFCQCPACKALDVTLNEATAAHLRDLGFSGADIEGLFAEKSDGLPYCLSNRYFTFYNKLARRLREVAPDGGVVVYAYDRYKYAPIDMKIEPNILVMLIGFNAYPVTAEERQLQIDNAIAWRLSGAKQLIFRPNSFCFSPAMGIPWSQARAMGQDFKFLLDSGIVATDWDRLNGFWATAAPTYYVIARMHWDTDLDEEQLLKEFDEAFGPAAPAIAAYFDHWERVMTAAYTRPDLADIIRKYDPKAGRRGRWRGVHLLLTQEEFDKGRELLGEARRLAEDSGDAALLEKIAIFELGLRQGELIVQQSRFANDVIDPDKDVYYEKDWPVAKELFRLRTELLNRHAYNGFWHTVWSMQHNDLYGERVCYDFEGRPWQPVMTPAFTSWRFAPDPLDEGEAQGWPEKRLEEAAPYARPIDYAFFAQMWDAAQVVKRWKVDSGKSAVVHGWYQTTFNVREGAMPEGAVLYLPYIKGPARIWIDGRHVKDVSAEEGRSEKAVTVDWSKVGIAAGKPFVVTVKVSSPDEPGGLFGPVYVAEPAVE